MYVRIFYVCLSYHGWYSHAVWAVLSWYLMYVKIFVPWKVITCSTRENFLVLNVRKKKLFLTYESYLLWCGHLRKKPESRNRNLFLSSLYRQSTQISFREKKLSRLNLRIGTIQLLIFSWWKRNRETQKKTKQQSTSGLKHDVLPTVFLTLTSCRHPWLIVVTWESSHWRTDLCNHYSYTARRTSGPLMHREGPCGTQVRPNESSIIRPTTFMVWLDSQAWLLGCTLRGTWNDWPACDDMGWCGKLHIKTKIQINE